MRNKQSIWSIIIILVGLGLAVKAGLNTWRLWKLGGKVTEVQSQVDMAERENRELSARLEYVKSPEFVEREARDKLGFGREGETIVVIPDEKSQAVNHNDQKGQIEANWRKWVKLYIGI